MLRWPIEYEYEPAQPMTNRRKPSSQVTPAYEDSGLFKSTLTCVMVDLIPQVRRSSRQDFVVRGLVNGSIEIEVFFAGRRSKEVGPLQAKLKAMWAQALRHASAANLPVPDVDAVRCPVRIEGSWRPRFQRDPTGMEVRSYQLIAARWSMIGRNGKSIAFGSRPDPSVEWMLRSGGPQKNIRRRRKDD